MNRWMEKRMGILLLAIGVSFILIGIHRQEVGTVVSKAVAICLECIGIG